MNLETLPLQVRDAIVNLFPPALHWTVHHLLSVTVILTVFGTFFAFTTIAERKLLARLQNRLGPNRAGLPWFRKLKLWGLTQPFADAIKAITKEDIVPAAADQVLHFLAPVLIVAFSLLGFAVLLLFYFWGMTIVVLSIARYMIPPMGLLTVLCGVALSRFLQRFHPSPADPLRSGAGDRDLYENPYRFHRLAIARFQPGFCEIGLCPKTEATPRS